MIDWRIYRLGFLAVVPAVVAALFAVEPIAKPLPPGIATTGFDGRAAAFIARQIESLGEERTRGSRADGAAGDIVAERFGAIPAGTLLRTPLTESGLTPGLASEIVSVLVPGESADAILVLAPRVAASEAGRLATATATGILAQLAESFGEVRHEHTLIFASVPDAASASALARRVSLERRVIGSIAIDDARGLRTNDVLLRRAPGDLIASRTLAETAHDVIGGEGLPEADAEAPLEQVARLSVGLAFGTQARMLGEGIDAVALSGTGELPPREADGAPARVVRVPLETMGEITLRVVQALDAAPELPDEPGAYVRLGDNTVPGWAFALVALSLLVPALLASIDALARAARRGFAAARALQSVLVRSLPLLAPASLLYLMAGLGIVADPVFPFNPLEFGLGGGEIVALALLAVSGAGVAAALRVDTVSGAYGPATLAAAAGFVAVLAILGIWVANPFTALLLVPLAHVWVLAAGSRRPNRALAAGAIAAALTPMTAAVIYVAGVFDLGFDGLWTAAMLVTGGQLRVAQVLIACGLGGAVLATAAASMRRNGTSSLD